MDKNISITIYDASNITGISIDEYFSFIKTGYIKTKSFLPSTLPSKDEDKIYLSKEISFSLSYLKPCYQLQYILNLYKDNYLQVDFIYLYKNDINKYKDFLLLIKAIVAYFNREDKYYITDNKTKLANMFLNEYKLSTKRIYEISKELSLQGYRFLYKKNHHKQHYSLCPASIDFVNSEFIYYQKQSNKEVYNNLIKEKEFLGKDFCNNCPHNPNNLLFSIFELETKQKYPTCEFVMCLDKDNNGLVIPNNVSSISRFKNDIDRSLLYLVRNGEESWTLKYGHMINNKPEEKTNEIFYMDCHELPCYIYAYDDAQGNSVYQRPWVIIVLEGKSKVIAGSVFTLKIDSYLASQALASAIAFKVNSPICGSCRYLFTDNGTEMKNRYLTISKETQKIIKKQEENTYYFYPENLCTALNIKHVFSKPDSPWQNDIERTNQTIDQEFYKGLKECFINKKKKNYDEDLLKEIDNLKSNGIDNFEKAAVYWHKYVVTNYNNSFQKDSTTSRIQTYINDVEKGLRNDSIFPSGSVLAVALKHKQKVTIKRSHFIFNKINYESSSLSKQYNGKVYAYGFEEETNNDGVFLYEDNGLKSSYLGMAFPSETIKQIEKDRYKLKRNLAIRKKQLSEKYQEIEFIKFMHNETGFHNRLMNTYDIVNNTIVPYASKDKQTEDNNELVNLKDLQCDLAYVDELKLNLSQRQLAIQSELLILIIFCINQIIIKKQIINNNF